MRVFRTVIQRAVVVMFHAGQRLPLGGVVAFELSCDDHPQLIRQILEQLAEEHLRGLLVSSALHQDVKHTALLIHRPRS